MIYSELRVCLRNCCTARKFANTNSVYPTSQPALQETGMYPATTPLLSTAPESLGHRFLWENYIAAKCNSVYITLNL